MAAQPIYPRMSLREEKNREREKALRILKKLKKKEAATPMFCEVVNGTKVCFSTKERLNEVVEYIKNK